MTRDLVFSRKLLIYLVGPVMAFLIGDQIIDQLGYPSLYVQPTKEVIPELALVAPWYLYLASLLLFGGSVAIIAFYFCRDVVINFGPCSRTRILVGTALLFGINVFVILIEPYIYSVPRGYYRIGRDLMSTYLNSINKFSTLMFAEKVANGVSALAVSIVIIGCISAASDQQPGSRLKKVEFLGRQADRLNIYLYLASLHLVLGLFLMKAWQQLPFPLITSEQRDAYNQLSSNLLALHGCWFTTIILAYYIPISMKLAGRIMDEERAHFSSMENVTIDDRRKWRDQMNLTVYRWDAYKSIGAALAPMLIGSLGVLFQAVGIK
jgi:hypothetical protein